MTDYTVLPCILRCSNTYNTLLQINDKILFINHHQSQNNPKYFICPPGTDRESDEAAVVKINCSLEHHSSIQWSNNPRYLSKNPVGKYLLPFQFPHTQIIPMCVRVVGQREISSSQLLHPELWTGLLSFLVFLLHILWLLQLLHTSASTLTFIYSVMGSIWCR